MDSSDTSPGQTQSPLTTPLTLTAPSTGNQKRKKPAILRWCLLSCGGCLGLVFIAVFLFGILLQRSAKEPLVGQDYLTKVDASLALEKKYTADGAYKVKSREFESHQDFFKHYKVWYPSDLEASQTKKYPIVVFANGTGVIYSRYEPIFRHLASWGFVVIGNDDPSSMFGKSTSLTLDYVLALNNNPKDIFHRKLDTKHIGVSGHSQGAVGAIHAVTKYPNSHLFTSIYAASATSQSVIHIPYFMVAGTGNLDANGLAPLARLREGFDKVEENVPAVIARRKHVDHGDVLTHADGYMTAWFRYTLMNDPEAKQVFAGNSPEILRNSANWQDVKVKGLK